MNKTAYHISELPPRADEVRLDLVIGSVIVAMKLAYLTAQHTDCAKPLPAVSPKQDAPCTKLLRSRATPA
jgi:hypothetical protein